MADSDSAPVAGQPEGTSQQQGQPDWAAERANFERQIAEFQQRESRYKEQITGSQRAFQALKERGYESWDQALPDLETASKARKAGLDFGRFGKAFEPEEPQGQVFDLNAAAERLTPVLKERLAQEQRNEQIAEITGSLPSAIKESLGDISDRELRLATGFVRDMFFEQVTDPKTRPDKAFKEAIAEYRKFSKDAEAESQAQRAVELADKAKEPTRTPRDSKGGMGKPEDQSPDDKRSRLVAALERKYAKRQQASMSRSE